MRKNTGIKNVKGKGITINTDASFHPVHKTAGFAFWIVCNTFKIQKSGNFLRAPKDSEEAEMMCIGNAIVMCLRQDNLPKLDWFIINTDCMNAVHKIENGVSPLGAEINGYWKKLIEKLGSKKNQFRHVKAHSGKNDSRSYVNEWCDTEAKKWMRDAVKKLNKKA